MKIFAIKDELDKTSKQLAYLFYYENEEKFFIEIPEKIDPDKLPMMLTIFHHSGYRTINSYWSKEFVKQRIIPSDRQNLGSILKNAGLKYYDEYQLLVKSKGKCSHDSCYIEMIKEKDLPKEILKRNLMKVEDVIPLDKYEILVFFRDGLIRRISLKDLIGNKKEFKEILKNKDIFYRVKVESGGNGIVYSEKATFSAQELYKEGTEVNIDINILKSFIQQRVIDTQEAAALLDCSKQNINDLVKKGKLTPIKENQKYRLFLRGEVLERRWK